MHVVRQKITALIGATAAFVFASGAASANPVVANIQLVTERRIDRYVIEATYRVDAKSTGGAFTAVSAAVTSTNAATTIIDGALTFPDLASGGTVTSIDTFTIRHDLHTPFQNSFLSFQFSATPVTTNSPPTANAGPDQTVAVSATAHLNGSGSSDPDGNPLTFLWTLVSAPTGSTAVLMSPTAVNPTLVIDRPATTRSAL